MALDFLSLAINAKINALAMSKPKSSLDAFSVTKPERPTRSTASAPKPTRAAASEKTHRKKAVRIKVEAARQLTRLKADTDTTEQDLMAQALNLLFEQHGLPKVA